MDMPTLGSAIMADTSSRRGAAVSGDWIIALHNPPHSHANVVQAMCFTLCIRPCQLMLDGGNLVRRMNAAT